MAYPSLLNSINRKLQEKELSISQLERQAGLARTTIMRILAGSNPNPTLDTLTSIAKALECDISELLGEQVKEKPAESHFEQICKSLPWNNELFAVVTNSTCDYLKKVNKDPTFEQTLNTIVEVYNYCIMKKDGKFDSSFHDWYMQRFLEKI